MSGPEREPAQPPPGARRSSFGGAGDILESFDFEDPCADEPRLGFKPLEAPES
jgi:hypothetical protein